MTQLSGKRMDSSVILEYLDALERRCRSGSSALPKGEATVAYWQGLAYSIGEVNVVSSMSEISEMLPFPGSITRVPGAREWMLGLANIRGNLLPIVDLQAFLGEKPVVPKKDTRVLVIRHRGASTGLVVPNVLGMRNLAENLRVDGVGYQGRLEPYVYDFFRVGDVAWPVFSMAALVANPEFMVAAA